MRNNPFERKPGIESLAEAEPQAQEYDTVDDLNADTIDQLVTAARARMKLRNSTEQEGIGAMDELAHRYKRQFRAYWQARGMSVDASAEDAAWQKVRKAAVNSFIRIMSVPQPK